MPETNNPILDEAIKLVTRWRVSLAHNGIRTSEADVPKIVRLLALFTQSGLGQRTFCTAVGLGLSTFTTWRAGCRRKKVPWPALCAALGREPWQPRLSTHPHAVYCRAYRAAKKAQRYSVSTEAHHASA